MELVFKQLEFIAEDVKRWRASTVKDWFYCLLECGFWCGILYRISRALYLVEVPGVKILTRLAALIVYKINEFLGAAIPPSVGIGPGLYIGHSGLIRIHPEVVCGKNLSIGPGVFIAARGVGHQGVPRLGDDVYVGTGAKILGPVVIGDRAKIGANAVVVKDVPADATAVGVPARIIKAN